MPGHEARPIAKGGGTDVLSGAGVPGRGAVVEDAASVAAILTSSGLRQLFAGLGLSEPDWAGILAAFDCRPSRHRERFGESVGLHADMLAIGVFDDDPSPEGEDLARRLGELPLLYRVTVLGVLELFRCDARRSATRARWLRRLAVRRFRGRTEIPASLQGSARFPSSCPAGPRSAEASRAVPVPMSGVQTWVRAC